MVHWSSSLQHDPPHRTQQTHLLCLLAKPFATRNPLIPPWLNSQVRFGGRLQTSFGRSTTNKINNLPSTKPLTKKLTSKKRPNFFHPIKAFKVFFCIVTPLRLAKALCPHSEEVVGKDNGFSGRNSYPPSNRSRIQ